MGLPKKKQIEYGLWDGLIKPVEWYFSEEGKCAFERAFENNEEMNAQIEKSNWISIVFNVCYQSTKKPIAEKKNWLVKYFYEFMLSRYSVKMAANEHTLILMTLMASSRTALPYPACLDEEKHPVLYFFSQVKNLLPEGYSEQTYPVLKDIVHYIYNVFTNLGKDVSREDWLYMKVLYVDDRGRPQKYSLTSEKLSSLVAFQKYLNY